MGSHMATNTKEINETEFTNTTTEESLVAGPDPDPDPDPGTGHESPDYQHILDVVTRVFKIRKLNPRRQPKEVKTKIDEIKTIKEDNVLLGIFVYSTLRKKHLLKNLSEENSKQLSLKRLETNQELTINTVFKEPPHFLWLRKDSLLVSPFPIECHVVLLKEDPPKIEIKGPKWAIFQDKGQFHFEEKCLDVPVEVPVEEVSLEVIRKSPSRTPPGTPPRRRKNIG